MVFLFWDPSAVYVPTRFLGPGQLLLGGEARGVEIARTVKQVPTDRNYATC